MRRIIALIAAALFIGAAPAVTSAAPALACSVSVSVTHGTNFVQAHVYQACGRTVHVWERSNYYGFLLGRGVYSGYSVIWRSGLRPYEGGWYRYGVYHRTF